MSLRGKWTGPHEWPSAHLISEAASDGHLVGVRTRCGRGDTFGSSIAGTITDEPPATGKTCESCLRLSRRDG